MKILIIGSGAREHAILAQVIKNPGVKRVFCAPGNAGMALMTSEKIPVECVSIPVENTEKLCDLALKNKVDLTLVGPEKPLTQGLVDSFQDVGLKVFGPSKRASILEGSKIFTKEFCVRHDIPTAPFGIFAQAQEARDYIHAKNTYPIVIKADGLAAGKGVVVAQNQAQADQAITDMMLYEKFGDAGRKIVIEDFMPGEEASFIVLTDGKNFVEFPASQDHKRVFDHDEGPNTGGMGAYAPAPVVTPALRDKVIQKIIQPILQGMAAEDRTYLGFLYAGLMISPMGEPRLVEINCRLGDPEAEVILPLLKTDFVHLMQATLAHKLLETQIELETGFCVGVVLASGGYPEKFKTGLVIEGLEKKSSDVAVFHAGTRQENGHFVTDGGRVLVLSAKAETLPLAIEKVYQHVKKIHWDGIHYRNDIGAKAL
jgi:phosphoribosylamine--glycine ligase